LIRISDVLAVIPKAPPETTAPALLVIVPESIAIPVEVPATVLAGPGATVMKMPSSTPLPKPVVELLVPGAPVPWLVVVPAQLIVTLLAACGVQSARADGLESARTEIDSEHNVAAPAVVRNTFRSELRHRGIRKVPLASRPANHRLHCYVLLAK
jgi:hypothetical protein